MCLVFDQKDQAGAAAGCKAGYMYLFQIDSDIVQTTLFAFLDQALSAGGYNFMFRVDGVRDATDKNWYYYSKGTKTPAFAGLKWYISSDTLDGFDSLVVTNLAYPVQKAIAKTAADGVQSNDPSPLYICEY